MISNRCVAAGLFADHRNPFQRCGAIHRAGVLFDDFETQLLRAGPAIARRRARGTARGSPGAAPAHASRVRTVVPFSVSGSGSVYGRDSRLVVIERRLLFRRLFDGLGVGPPAGILRTDGGRQCEQGDGPASGTVHGHIIRPVHGPPSTVRRPRSAVHGPPSTVRRPRSAVHGPPSRGSHVCPQTAQPAGRSLRPYLRARRSHADVAQPVASGPALRDPDLCPHARLHHAGGAVAGPRDHGDDRDVQRHPRGRPGSVPL